MSVDWNYYNSDKFERVNSLFLPARGEGDNKATQLCTALNKLIYKWYNDGDVYDNTYILEGWANDLSSYANWIYKNFPQARGILDRIKDCYDEGEYEDLLQDLADRLWDMEDFENLAKEPKVGSIYDCSGPFSFDEHLEDEDDDEDEEWEDDDWRDDFEDPEY